MKIKGTDYGFCLTLDAGIQLSKLCPDNDLTKIGKVLETGDYATTAENLAAVAEILNAGYCDKEAHEHGRQATRIGKAELLEILKTSPIHVYSALSAEIYMTIARDLLGEIETEDAPGAGSKKDETGAEA